MDTKKPLYVPFVTAARKYNECLIALQMYKYYLIPPNFLAFFFLLYSKKYSLLK